MFRIIPRILPKFISPSLCLRKVHKPIAVSSIFTFLLYSHYKAQTKSCPKFISSSQSSGLTIFSKSTNQPIASGFFLTKDGYFLTILNCFPSQNPQQINSNLYYVQPWADSSVSYPLMLDYVLPEENLIFGHIITTDQEFQQKIKNIDFSDASNCEIGNKAYLFSKSHTSQNIIESGYIIDKSNETMVNINHPDTTIYGSAIMSKEGKIIGMLQPMENLNDGRSSKMMENSVLKSICDQYIAKKEVKKAFLGFSVKNAENGITVIKINSGGPANVAGMKLGDVIMEVNGKKITEVGQFIRMVGYGKGQRISIKLMRNGTICDIDLTTG